ncbi:GNAT family N-acetyltransferase [Imhoffiella purpurea]|uniref:GNAT family N-acetyltransferase n=1 Tax=Imhoffiella purpurea TaxID=1249627 RepID=UPI0009E00822|nr:GNAT family N-acetyltransferase [Imhoffiella purpurea]
MKIEIKPSSNLSTALKDELIRLCTEAYEEQYEEILDELGPATHLLGFIEERLIAHALYINRNLQTNDRSFRTAFVEAVAVLPELQGQGFGSKIMSAIPKLLNSFDLAALSPSEESFYSRLGWELWKGPLFYRSLHGEQIETPDEQVMIYRLPLTGDLDLNSSLSCEWRKGDIW